MALVSPEVEQILGRELIELFERQNSLRLLDGCGVDIAGCSQGWSAEGLPGRVIVNADMGVVIARALAVLRGRQDLWGIRTRFKFLAETKDDPRPVG